VQVLVDWSTSPLASVTHLVQLPYLFIVLIEIVRVTDGKVLEHEYEPSEMGTRLALGWHHTLPRGRKGPQRPLKEGDFFSVGRYYPQKLG
jgi:hypothetical protein